MSNTSTGGVNVFFFSDKKNQKEFTQKKVWKGRQFYTLFSLRT